MNVLGPSTIEDKGLNTQAAQHCRGWGRSWGGELWGGVDMGWGSDLITGHRCQSLYLPGSLL